MGSSTSKPREGHDHPGHLPKVGTPADLARRHKARFEQVFGSTLWRVAIILAVITALVVLALLST